jgi:hypothetical protein
MMNRILKRPMFRMGGRSDDGIMSVRRGYAEGDSVRDSIEEEIYPSSLLGVTNRVLGNVNDALFNYGARPLANIAQFITKTNPEYIEPKDSKEEMIDLILKNRGVNLDADGEATATDISGNDLPPSLRGKKTDTTNSTNNETGEQSDQELIKSYMDMFSEAMGESEEDVSRQRYLELAKFGANLLGQPGGDLVGSIGRAAAPSIQGLAEGAARKSAANREIKLAGLKTAIAQMDDPTADKIKTLARMSGVSEKEVAKLMLDTDGDSSLEKIETTAKALEGTVGAEVALKIGQKLEKAGLDLEQVDPLPLDKKGKPKEGAPDGYYYDVNGKIYKVEKGKPSILKTN